MIRLCSAVERLGRWSSFIFYFIAQVNLTKVAEDFFRSFSGPAGCTGCSGVVHVPSSATVLSLLSKERFERFHGVTDHHGPDLWVGKWISNSSPSNVSGPSGSAEGHQHVRGFSICALIFCLFFSRVKHG